MGLFVWLCGSSMLRGLRTEYGFRLLLGGITWCSVLLLLVIVLQVGCRERALRVADNIVAHVFVTAEIGALHRTFGGGDL